MLLRKNILADQLNEQQARISQGVLVSVVHNGFVQCESLRQAVSRQESECRHSAIRGSVEGALN